MNALQKKILNIIQADFPIVPHPFADLAARLDSSEPEIIDRIKQLKQDGIIRALGPVFNPAHLGYTSTLVAAQVPPEKLDPFIAEVNALPGVSHNYGRQHAYNLWFTLTMRGLDLIDRTLHALREKFDIDKIYSLPAVRLFKIRVNFDFSNA